MCIYIQYNGSGAFGLRALAQASTIHTTPSAYFFRPSRPLLAGDNASHPRPSDKAYMCPRIPCGYCYSFHWTGVLPLPILAIPSAPEKAPLSSVPVNGCQPKPVLYITRLPASLLRGLAHSPNWLLATGFLPGFPRSSQNLPKR